MTYRNSTSPRWAEGLLAAVALLGLACASVQAANSSHATAQSAAGMVVDHDVKIPMRDGLELRANIYRPDTGRHPVIMTLGPYGKDVHFARFQPMAARILQERFPQICSQGSTCRYVSWETPDPERWVPHGYVVVRIDSRGAGKSPGTLAPFSPQEIDDYVDAVEWAGAQPWSNGKVGLLGISYFAVNQWLVAARQPKHLAAMIPWEGASDHYQDAMRHGGILSNRFTEMWWARQIEPVQHGNGESPFRDMLTGEIVTGPESISRAVLMRNRLYPMEQAMRRPLRDPWYAERSPDFSKIVTPFISVANLGGQGLHLQGNVRGFEKAASQEKWLRFETGFHFAGFYLPEAVELQRRFFDRYLKGVSNGWETTPRVHLAVRWPDRVQSASADAWPLPQAQPLKLFLDAGQIALRSAAGTVVDSVSYNGLSDGVAFQTAPMAADTILAGPISARLWLSSSTSDADVFVTLQLMSPEQKEVTFTGALDPFAPVTQGWQRASLRQGVEGPAEPLRAGVPVPVDVTIWPTITAVPKGYRLVMRVAGQDFERDHGMMGFYGSGPFLHDEPTDRPLKIFGGMNTIHTGAKFDSHLLLQTVSKDTLESAAAPRKHTGASP